jgi:SAM-dependent methyltransferase
VRAPRRSPPDDHGASTADLATTLTTAPDAQRLLLPALGATLAGLRGRQVLDIGGRAGLINGTPVIRAADPLRLPWPAAYFDAILSLDLVGLLAPDELPRHLTEASRVLRPGGRLICVVAEQPGIVFTTAAADPDEVRQLLAATLAATSQTAQIPEALRGIPGILRATAVIVDGMPTIPDPHDLVPAGTFAWTRVANEVVHHRLYGVDDILRASAGTHLSAVSVERHVDPTAGRVGSPLGSAYRTHSPFAMVHVVRREGRLTSLRPRFGQVSADELATTTFLR